MRGAVLFLLAMACQSAEHRELSSRLADHQGTRVVSNVLEAPAGAVWIRARVQTLAYRSESKDDFLRKHWTVWTDLLVEYPAERYASTRLATLDERDATVDQLVNQAITTYHLRAAGPDDVELSDDGKAWTKVPVPPP